MANVHIHRGSFNSGELSPLLGDRFAVEKVQSGCRLLRNMIPHVHGPAFRRPGLEYVSHAASDDAKSSLRGFNFSTTTGFILEFAASGLRVFSNGLEVPLLNAVPLPYTEDECGELQIESVNDVIYIVHPNHAPRQLVRYADNDWRLEAFPWVWPPMLDENVTANSTAAKFTNIEFPCELWPEFQIPAGPVTIEILPANTVGATTLTVTLQYWSGSAWVTEQTRSWTTTPLAPFSFTVATRAAWRITYSGAGFDALYTAREAVQEADPYGFYGFRATWETGLFELSILEGWPTTVRTFTPPAGSYQLAVNGGAAIPSGASAELEKWNGAAWVSEATITLTASTRTFSAVKTAAGTELLRFVWTGNAMYDAAGEVSTAFVRERYYDYGDTLTITPSATTGMGITLTASAALFESGHVGAYWALTWLRTVSTVAITETSPMTGITSSELIVSGRWDFFTYGTWTGNVTIQRKVGTTWDTVRTWSGAGDRNIIATGEEDPGTVMRIQTSGGGAATAGARFVLDASDVRSTGLVQISKVTSSTVAVADVIVDLFAASATAYWQEGAFSDVQGYPRAIAIHGQRLWFGGTSSNATRLWGSTVSDYLDFRTGTNDDAGVSFVPASQQSNRIQWLLSQGKQLLIGTNGDEWTLSGGTTDGPITPTSVNMQRRSAYGSAYLPGIVLGEVAVYVQRGGRKLRAASERQDSLTWAAVDLTILAEHVTGSGTGIVQFAVQLFPVTILWAVTSDGQLLGMTYENDQNVFAWHVHETDGLFESVAVVNNATTDEVWFTINRDGKRTVEKFNQMAMERDFTEPDRLCYVDSAVVSTLTPAGDVVTGLEHLEGRTVSVMGDGAEFTAQTVQDGQITLEREASNVVVGLPFTSELQPMRLEVNTDTGTSQGRRWRMSRVVIYLHESLGGEIADSPDSRFETLNYRNVSTAMDGPPELYTGEQETVIESTARENADVIVRTSGVHPFNVGSITLKGDIYGD